MASNGQSAHGSLLQLSDGAGGWITIAEQVNISVTTQADEANISIHNEPNEWGNWIAGPKNAEIAFTGNFIANDATHMGSNGVFGLYDSGTKKVFRVALPFATPVYFGGTGFFRQFNMDMPAGQAAALQFQTILRVDGQLTLAA